MVLSITSTTFAISCFVHLDTHSVSFRLDLYHFIRRTMKRFSFITIAIMTAFLLLGSQATPMKNIFKGSRKASKGQTSLQEIQEVQVDSPQSSPEYDVNTRQKFADPEYDFYQQDLKNLGKAKPGWQVWFQRGEYSSRWYTVIDHCQDAFIALKQDPDIVVQLLNEYGNESIGHILLLNKRSWHKIVARHLLRKAGLIK